MTIDNGLYDAPGDIWWDERQPLSAIRTALNPGRLRYLRGVLEQLGVEPPGKKALDVGCGGGLLAEELARMGFDVTGVDPSEPSLATARRHARTSGLRIEYLAGRGEDLPCADAGYHLVVCCDVLEHVADLDRVIAETARVLQPGGIYLYDTINRTLSSRLVMIKLLQDWRWARLVPPGLHDWRMFVKPSELIGLLEGHGLESRGYTGLAPGGRPLRLLRSFIRQRRGTISYGELGRQAAMVPSGRTSILYIGHAVKGWGERAPMG